MPGDEESWHLLRLRRSGKITGCARILAHPRNVGFPSLRIAASSVARSAVWRQHVAEAVESELRFARQNDFMTIEPGGWVVDEDLRGTCQAVSVAISTFAWAQILGDCIGFLTATVNHGSSRMLRRLGGRNLQAGGKTVPRYFDPAWGCNMELLRFDTESLNPRYETALGLARHRLLTAPVFSPDSAHTWRVPGPLLSVASRQGTASLPRTCASLGQTADGLLRLQYRDARARPNHAPEVQIL
jgi:hypothetical protein